MKQSILWLVALSLFCLTGCREDNSIPKPRGYFRIELPEKSYKTFQMQGFPYQFEFPVYANIEKDSLFFEQKAENPWWINLDMPTLNAKIYLSYKEITSQNTLIRLLNDSYTMSHYHTKKAAYIHEQDAFHTNNRVHGLFYDVGGNAASALQFYATDSQKHFIRGALYFNATPNVDSLKPLNEFLRKDVVHLIQTLSWTR